MYYFLCRVSVVHGRQIVTASRSWRLLNILQNDISIFKLSDSLRFISTASSKEESFPVSYLRNKFGLSQEIALRASKYLQFETPKKPDSFVAFLQKHGFSKTQIQLIVRRVPQLIVYDVEKTLLPKLEFFYSIGFSRLDLAKLLTNCPTVLQRSLEKQLIPSFNTLRDLFHSDDRAIKAIKGYTGLLAHDFDTHLFPNFNILTSSGVPESYILTMLERKPRSFMFNPARMKEIVEQVKAMGIHPSQRKFVNATFILRSMRKSTLEKKICIYKQWGWSDQDILEAFQKQPESWAVSEQKFVAIMRFLVNKMGLSSRLIAKQSTVLCQSLEKRIIPRALFAQDLLSLGLIKDFKLSTLFNTSEKAFLTMVVRRHCKTAPELLKLYGEKVQYSGKMISQLI